MGRNHSNVGEEKPEPSYAALCQRAMGPSPSACTASVASPSAGFLAYGMQLLKERLMRQALISPRYKGPSWRVHQHSSTFWRNVEIMRPIDEIIEVVNENDRYGPREVFEEPDADGRWACFVEDVHRKRQAAVRNPTADNLSWEPRPECQQRALTDVYRFGEPDYDSEEDDGVVRCSIEHNSRDPEQAGSPSRSGFHGPGLSIAGPPEDSKGRPIRSGPCPPESHRIHNDENDRPKETAEVCSFFDNSSWATAPDDSESSEDDEEAEAEEAESDWIFRLLEDFPTCVERTKRVASLDEEYGAIAMRDPASQWTSIDGYKLPRRIREYLADLSIANAQASRSSRDPDAKLDSDAHRWLFTTPRNEFVFDMLAMKMCSKGLQRCSWRFWDEPDDTNHGPQIIVTEPNGDEHYLIDLETFWSKLRQRSERHAAHSIRDPEKAMLTGDKVGGRLDDTVQEPVTRVEDEKALISVSEASSMTIRGQRWSTRLKQAFSRRNDSAGQSRTLLPLCHDVGEGGSSQFEDSETARLLGFEGTWDTRRRQGGEVDLLRLIGVLGLLRTIAYCCSKS
ncbi:hypothetical protein VMCG_01362 [Cytospora schulzeri]|uniref:Uncharacterized protein n=1 Tax=Cytospora schulzeri TaxID=448051 RepID=A0A423X632_9PEZI|nr:hypothetical protein VMCG_01362 [Valsa malicola]